MIELLLFHESDVIIAARLVGIASFAVGLAIKPSTRHAAVIQVAECG